MVERTKQINGGSIIFYLCLCSVFFKNVNTVEESRSWDETRPLVLMDFNILVDAGGEECYSQYVPKEATFYVSYQVLHGGDGMVGFAVMNPDAELVHLYEVKQSSSYAEDKSTGGYYRFCIYNQYSIYHKTVELYISSIKLDGWQKYQKEIEDLHVNVQNFTASISTLERNANLIHQFQSHRRSLEWRDMALLSDNNSYVQNWSIAQIIVIILTCSFQVYFVRKMFDIKVGSTKVQI